MAWIVRRDLKTGPRYYVRFSIKGHVRWFSAGKSRQSAEKIKSKLETELAEGRFLDKKGSSDWTLGRLKETYLSRMDSLRPKSAVWRRARFGQVVKSVGEQTPIESIDLGTLDRYAAARLKTVAPSTVNGEIAILRHALSLAFRWQAETDLSEYRLGGWRPVRGKAPRAPVFLPPKRVKALLGAARARGGHPYLFLRVFLATAARPGEILALTPQDVTGTVVWFRTLKGGKDRPAEIEPTLARTLRRSLPFEGSSEAKDRYRRFWRAVREEAKLGPIRLYDLRHTAISEMLRRGMDLREVQRMVGHRSARMTERYAHFAKNARPPKGLIW